MAMRMVEFCWPQLAPSKPIGKENLASASALSPSEVRFFRCALFQPGKKHAGFAFGIDDIHFEFRAASLPWRIFPDHFVVFFTILALHHCPFGAQFPGLFLIVDIDDRDGVRRFADKDKLGFRAELLDIGFLLDDFQRRPAFRWRKSQGG